MWCVFLQNDIWPQFILIWCSFTDALWPFLSVAMSPSRFKASPPSRAVQRSMEEPICSSAPHSLRRSVLPSVASTRNTSPLLSVEAHWGEWQVTKIVSCINIKNSKLSKRPQVCLSFVSQQPAVNFTPEHGKPWLWLKVSICMFIITLGECQCTESHVMIPTKTNQCYVLCYSMMWFIKREKAVICHSDNMSKVYIYPSKVRLWLLHLVNKRIKSCLVPHENVKDKVEN